MLVIFLFFASYCLYSQDLVLGVINDNPNYYDFSNNNRIKRQKVSVLNFIKSKLEKKYKNTHITVKYLDYDNEHLDKAANTIKNQINKHKPNIIFGPFSFHSIYFLKDTLEKSGIPFVSFCYSSDLKTLKNHYTPFEWKDVLIKLAIDKSIKITDKENPKVGAFVLVTDEHSKDSYASAKKYLKTDIHTSKIIHSRSQEYWNFKNKLDKEIDKMIAFSPDIVINANSIDLQEISTSIILKMLKKGFKGVFVDSGTWGCSKNSLDETKQSYKHVSGKSIGISTRQKKCFKDFGEDEKIFRNIFLDSEGRYYSSSGLFYKTVKHVLESILKSGLPINSKNINNVIQQNSYFEGFSNEKFNLYKTKDSPEFLHIYKYNFEKNFSVEKLENPYVLEKKNKKKVEKKKKL